VTHPRASIATAVTRKHARVSTKADQLGATPEAAARYREHFGPYRPFQQPGVSWVEVEIDEPWTVTFGFTSRDGALELSELHIVPTRNDEHDRGWDFLHRGRAPGTWTRDASLVPPGGLTMRAVRKMTGNLNGALRVALKSVPRPADHLAQAGFVSANRRSNRPPAARSLRDLDLSARVAVLYEDAQRESKPIYAFIAKQLGYAPSSIGNLVRRARDDGMLPKKATPGRASGVSTDKARRILDEQRQ
jgi:hypothetical protein